MRKIYASLLYFMVIVSVANAQRTISGQGNVNKVPRNSVQGPAGTTADCDTTNLEEASTWQLTYYTTGTNGNGGFVVGTNQYGDLEKAMFFDLSATSYQYLTGSLFYFRKAQSNKAANNAKNVKFKVYDASGAGGSPGAQLGTTVEVPLNQIKPDVDGNFLTEVVFPAAISLPANKQVFISVDVSNFTWVPIIGSGTRDSITLACTLNGSVTPNTAWEKWEDGDWYDFVSAWGLETQLGIFPYVSNNSTGCSALPVRLLSFAAERNNKDVTLTWRIADEIGMKGYEVQRSNNNGNFVTVASVSALNTQKNQAYAITDKNAFSASSAVQYRLKQIDGDGSVQYSKVVTVKSSGIINDVSFANPFVGALRLNLNLAAAQNVAVYVYDMQGKLVASQSPKMYSAAVNSITVPGTEFLKAGMYSVKVIAGGEQASYKAVKQ